MRITFQVMVWLGSVLEQKYSLNNAEHDFIANLNNTNMKNMAIYAYTQEIYVSL